MRAGDNPEVTKLVERESAAIARGLAVLPAAFSSSREAIGALLATLSQRQRYFALIGEHFSVFGFDGIIAMDQLDEAVLRAAQEVLRRRPASRNDSATSSKLSEVFMKLPKLEQYPVGYMVLFTVRKMYEAINVYDAHLVESLDDLEDEIEEEAMNEESDDGTPLKRNVHHAEFRPISETQAPKERNLEPVGPYEDEFLTHVTRVVDSYITSRTMPVARHFSDLRREYWVVARMHCKCGQPKYEVKMQSLATGADGGHADRLDVKCGACGDERTLEFPLPFFGDLSIA